LKVIQDLEQRKSRTWFPAKFKDQQLLAQYSPPPGQKRKPPPMSQEQADAQEVNKAFFKAAETLPPAQRKMFMDLCMTSGGVNPSKLKEFQESLTDDQKFLFKKALLGEDSARVMDKTDVDPSVYTSVHMWIEGRGFDQR